MDVTLTAQSGRSLGSGASGRLRRDGQVPAVVYGMGLDPVAISVEWTELRRALTTDAGTNALITLNVDGEANLTLVKDLQRDPLKRSVTHVDFLRVDPNVMIEVEVPIVLVGEPVELSREGGIVEQHLQRLTVMAKPTAIPNEFEIDISELTSYRPIKVSAISLPDGVTTEVDADELIAAGFIPRGQDEEAAAEGEAVEGEAVEGEAAVGDADASESDSADA